MIAVAQSESVSAVGASSAGRYWLIKFFSAAALSAVVFLGFTTNAQSQTYEQPFSIGAEVTQRLLSQIDLAPVSTDNAFGEQISPSTGALTFTSVDVSIPGNGPEISVIRSFDPARNARPHYRSFWMQDFVDWEFDIPRITTTGQSPNSNGVITNDAHKVWIVSGSSPYQRCSNFTPPSNPPTNSYHWSVWWGGVQLEIPGRTSQSILKRDPTYTPAPTAGGTSQYPLVTKDHWMISCLPQTKNGVEGEAFLALAPDGTKYWFDYYVVEVYPRATDTALRFDVHLYPSRIEDRFGNFVTYTWTGRLLTKMEASDGRAIQINYESRGNDVYRVSSVVANPGTADARTWTYSYAGAGINSTLTTVTLPDQSTWKYQLSGLSNMCNMMLGEEENYAIICDIEYNDGLGVSSVYTGSATSPSGLVGTFKLKNALMSNMNPGPCTAYFYPDPCSITVQSIVSKQYSGPGITTQNWSYDTCINFQSDFEPYYCPNLVAGDSMVMAVVDPMQKLTVTVTGMRGSQGPMGHVMRILDAPVFDVAPVPNPTGPASLAFLSRPTLLSFKRSEIIDYQMTADGYPTRIGIAPQADDTINAGMRQLVERIYPVKRRVISQDGATFSGTVGAYDLFGRPLSQTKASSLGYTKLQSTEYRDSYQPWTIGQIAKVVEDGLVVQEVNYDLGTALPTAMLNFGKLQRSVTYDISSAVTTGQRGTLLTVIDGNNNATTFSGWKRGAPQNIQHADGTTRSVVIDDNGWIDSVTDEKGFTTTYTQDEMGRLKTIIYPANDTVAWAPVSLSFQQISTYEHGLAPGHWRSSRYEGNKHINAYYDAMWRPVLEESLDASDIANTLSQTVTRYDAEGRVIFQSYPQRGVDKYTDITQGVHTEYDALGRVTSMSRDSELTSPSNPNGLLTTVTEYLPGFQTRVTNPRGYQTTTSYQVFDTPTYQYPTLIQGPQGTTTAISRDNFGKPFMISR